MSASVASRRPNGESLTRGLAVVRPASENNEKRRGMFIGDWMRNSRPDLEKVINAGVCDLCLVHCYFLGLILVIQVKTLLFNGDAVSVSIKTVPNHCG